MDNRSFWQLSLGLALALGVFTGFGLVISSSQLVLAQSFIEGDDFIPPISVTPPPPPPMPTPPPPPRATFTPPIILPTNPFSPPVVVPTDVTRASLYRGGNPVAFDVLNSVLALNGVRGLPADKFPKPEDGKEKGEGILVKGTPQTDFERPSPIIVKLDNGLVLVSIRRPSSSAFVETVLGTIAVSSNADVFVSTKDGKLRVFNVDGRRETVKIELKDAPFSDGKPVVLSVLPGYEVVLSKRLLSRFDLRPGDGIARRHSKILENGHIAVSEFSLDSLLKSSELLADLTQSAANSREKRLLGDMSKMASVLNYMRGQDGFDTGNSAVAQK
jgi:hypothetical protein